MVTGTANTKQVSVRLPHDLLRYVDEHGNRSANLVKLIRRAQRQEAHEREEQEMLAAGYDGSLDEEGDPDWSTRNAAVLWSDLD